jgi:hypothetical protein
MRLNRTNQRRGIILLVVLSLLTLFAIVGVAFVLYADSEATSARVAREAETQQRADVDPQQALSFLLGQLIYDVNDDATGVTSGLRGHSFARTMYGYNYTAIGAPGVNVVPYSGVGRLHYTQGGLGDDYNLVNYTWFQADSLVRDPERYGMRASPSAAMNPNYVGGNASYTYPDLNNFFLAAVNASGQVLVPSFHRPWLFNPGMAFNNMTNPNWTNQQGKYLTLRPRPAEHPNFPMPDDTFGDVKNLIWGQPSVNDSIWIDPGGPVMTAPDGTQFKMLVAPLIIDLDGRINLNTAGNIVAFAAAPNAPHSSNQGLGPWEVNLSKVLQGDSGAATPLVEWINLFKGATLSGGNFVPGRYVPGNPPTPSTAGASIPLNPSVINFASNPPHFYAQLDYNGLNEAAPGTPSARIQPPGFGGAATSCFPTYPANAYLNGGGGTELTNHPSLFDALRTALPINGLNTRVFRASDIEPLLRPNSSVGLPVDSGSAALGSDLIRLCLASTAGQTNFGPSATNLRYRNLVTPLSMDLGVPGVTPYWYSTGGNPVQPYPPLPITNAQALTAPVSNAVPFPPIPAVPGGALPAITNNPGATPPNFSEFGGDWRALSAAMGRIRLNQPLPPYPHLAAAQNLLPRYNYTPLVAWGTAYDLTNANINSQFQAALNARQALANQIYRTLVSLTGVQVPAPPTMMPPPPAFSQALIPCRWLAQLAVNIVDYIDEDDISTPFNFFQGAPDGSQIGATQGNDDPGANAQNLSGNNNTGADPMFWVFGTELPKVVLNEVLAQAQDSNPADDFVAGESVKLWLELFNTMPAAASLPANSQPQDGYRVPLYMSTGANTGYSPYRITITQNLMLTGAAPLLPDTSANVLGKANIVAPFPQSTTDNDFSPANSANIQLMGGGNQPASVPPVTGAGVDPSGFFLIGPKTPLLPAGKYQEPFVAAGVGNMPPGVPTAVPVLRTDNVTYAPTATTWVKGATTDERTTGLAVLLRRLANPYLPFNPNPSVPDPKNPGNFLPNPAYNPYVTVDSIPNVPIRSNTPAPTDTPPLRSRGKRQPYAALTQLVPPAAGGVANAANVQGFSPVVDQTGTQLVSHVVSTFGNPNAPLPSTGSYDWLVHLDRPPISPIELLHVSGYQPYMLTQQFIVPQANSTGDNNASGNVFRHYVPWLDYPQQPAAMIPNLAAPWWYDTTTLTAANQTHRLYRLFEFLECGDRAAGVWGQGRIPGKVNINTVWDKEILRALADANISIGIANDGIVDAIFQNMLNSRSPGGSLGQNDRPFLPLSVGLNSPPGGQYPNGTSVTTDTLLRFSPAANQLLLFQNPADAAPPNSPPYWHPYLQTQLLNKLYNNITTRSNTFAVFLTIGFFEVEPGGAVGNPSMPRLGREIGRSEGRQIRHRMFAIVDRTNLSVFSTTYTGAQITVTPASGPQTVQVTFGALTGTNRSTGAPWTIGAGSTLVFEPGTDNEEMVTLQSGAAAGQFQATFYKSHAPNVIVTQRGNPGPYSLQPYDPRNDSLVVPYFSIID